MASARDFLSQMSIDNFDSFTNPHRRQHHSVSKQLPTRAEFHSNPLLSSPTSSPPLSQLGRRRINNPRLFAQGDLGEDLGPLTLTLIHYINDHVKAIADLAAYVDACHEDRKMVDWDYFGCLPRVVDELEDMIWRMQRWIRTRRLYTRWIDPRAPRLMEPVGCPRLIADPDREGRFYVLTPNIDQYARYYT